jgi:hypothetical protein
MDGIEENVAGIHTKIRECDIDNIYNFDKTGVFYRIALDKTIVQR